MDAPKCRMCGQKHWGLCADEVKASLDAMADPVAAKSNTPLAKKYREDAKSFEICPTCGTDLGAKIRRKAYMKHYMRKHRGTG